METLAADLRQMRRTPLHDSHVSAIREVGEIVEFAEGEMVARVGEPANRFVYLLEGEIEVVHPFTGERYLPSSLGPTQFAGDIAFLNGGANTLGLRAAKPTRAIVVPRETMQAGASAYVLKDSPASDLAGTIRRVANGEQVVDAELVAASWASPNPLSRREQQCLRLAGDGLSNSEIAASVFLSEGTVRNYLSAALQKLNAGNRTEAARLARQKGWI